MRLLLGYPIGNGLPAGYYGPERGTYLMDFGKAIELGRECTGGIKLFVFGGAEGSCLFYVLEDCY